MAGWYFMPPGLPFQKRAFSTGEIYHARDHFGRVLSFNIDKGCLCQLKNIFHHSKRSGNIASNVSAIAVRKFALASELIVLFGRIDSERTRFAMSQHSTIQRK